MAFSPARSVSARPALSPSLFERLVARAASGVLVDVLLVGMLVGVAGSIRWPYLLLSPQFPSIGDVIQMALDVADGRAFYLADDSPYLGVPFMYILAAAYKIFGPSIEVTLLVPWVIGSLTIIPTYLLGRELAGRPAGLLAGALMATAGAHVVVSSHVPLSHSLTPLVSTVTIWLLARAIKRDCGKSLAVSGLCAGLAFQTHPTVFPLLAGSAIAALLTRPAWLKTRWPYIGLALVVVGYSTLLVYHVQTNFAVIGDIEGKQQRYLDGAADVDESSDDSLYLKNLSQLSISLARMASGEINERDSSEEYLRDPWVLAYPALALVGAVVAARRGNPLLAVALLLAVFWPPLLSGKYKPILDGRYLMPDLPVLFVDIAVAFTAMAGVVARSTSALRLAGVGVLFVAATFLVAHPLTYLDRFYQESQEDGFSNAAYFRTLDLLKSAGAGPEPVVMDARLIEVKSAGGGKAHNNFAWMFAVSRIPTENWSAAAGPTPLVGRLAILHRNSAEELRGQVQLVSLDGRRLNGKDPDSYRAYRIGAIGEQAASAAAPTTTRRR